MTGLRTWLAHVLLGPVCVHRCGHRARGWRTLADHYDLEHAGDKEPTS